MPLSYEAADRLFQHGEFSQLVATAPTFELRKALEPRHRVILANALALIGDLDGAQQLAGVDNNDTGPLGIRSYTTLTLGLVAWRRGQIELALDHLQASVRLAHESKDVARMGWS